MNLNSINLHHLCINLLKVAIEHIFGVFKFSNPIWHGTIINHGFDMIKIHLVKVRIVFLRPKVVGAFINYFQVVARAQFVTFFSESLIAVVLRTA